MTCKFVYVVGEVSPEDDWFGSLKISSIRVFKDKQKAKKYSLKQIAKYHTNTRRTDLVRVMKKEKKWP